MEERRINNRVIQVAIYELKAYKYLFQLVHEHCTLLKMHAQERRQELQLH